ncbi:MAG: cupin domain-containing protein [Betaproteobacteria bacterium]
MKTHSLLHSLLLSIALALYFPAGALALEETPAIKVTPLIKITTSWNGKPIVYPQGQAEISGMVIEIAPGAETGWHAHPVPSFGMMLEGTLEVTLKDGKKKRLSAGEGLVEVVDTLHNGRNVGKGPVRLVVFYAGAVGKPLTVKP